MHGEALVSHVTAGFGERLAASLIDLIVVAAPSFLIGVILPGDGLAFFVWAAVWAAYSVYFWTTSGATIGKMALRLKVVYAESGELIDGATAVRRYAGYWLSALPLFLGFLWVLWDPRHEAWHDKIAHTRVVFNR
jgi:uncharacterized RDD family membrane protein YckC